MSTIICDACGLPEIVELIDAKPTGGDWEGDYDRNECIACYGSGYDMLSWSHKVLSVRPELAGLYDAYIEPRRLAGVVWC